MASNDASLASDMAELDSLVQSDAAKSEQAAYQQFQAAQNPQNPPPSGATLAAPAPANTAMDILRNPMPQLGGGIGGLGASAAQALGSITGMDSQDTLDTAIRSVPLAASIAGGAGGAALSGGNPAVAAGAAAMGNMAGELAIAPYYASKNEPAIKPAAQLGRESLGQGAGEFLGPLTTRMLNWGVKTAVGPFQRSIPTDTRIIKEAVGVRKANDILKSVAEDMRPALERKYGKEVADNITSGVLLSTDLTENKVMDMAENYVGPSVFAPKKLRALRQAQQDIVDNIPQFIAKTYGEVLDPEDAMNALSSSIKNIDEVRRGQAGSLYDYIGKQMETAPAPMDPAYLGTRMSPKFGTSIVKGTGSTAGLVNLAKLKNESGPIAHLRGALSELNLDKLNIEDTKGVLDMVQSLPDTASFDSVKQVKSFLGNVRRALREVDPQNTKIAVLSEAESGLAKAMHSAVKEYDRANPDKFPLSKVFKYANQLYGDIEQKTGSSIIEGWVQAIDKKGVGPEYVKELVKTPSNARLFLNSVGKDSRSADIMRQWHAQYLWDEAKGANGTFNPDKFINLLTDTMKSDSGVARELWGDAGIQDLRRFAAGPKFIGTRDSTLGRSALSLKEGAIIASFAGVPATMTYAASSDENPKSTSDIARSAVGGLVTYGISVNLLARALASPTLRSAVLDARRFGPRTKQGISAIGQLLAAATKDEVVKIPDTATPDELKDLNEAIGKKPAQAAY
jgi:hypothetical protein